MSNDMEIAETIQRQLGPGSMMMMGAKNLLAVERGLQFRIGRNAQGWSGVTITLDPADLYVVKFWKLRKVAHVPTVVKEHEVPMIYADQLRTTIESNTGLALSL